ncbi:hypothetical protein RKE29_12255 [Streptomyces sp. B1866]|uniref:hypothetical protein n=1 Tax=Streptomyces sp. B1866 TaxID=3075431 RepID=UPI00288EA357|nr:hypothetical protein [Streptomyces sp. B1866]MDT3397411.1 hypothetical protein [Streptomyces sp. B1866]
MTSGKPTAAQRRRLLAAGPDGLLAGPEAELRALAGQGLAVRHPRPPHRYFLTPAGRRLRDLLAAPAAEPPADGGPGVFAARTGAESGPYDPAGRLRQAHSAWQGLLEMRRLTGRDGTSALPCAWERAHLVAAAALALEAAGCRPYAPAADAGPGTAGYRVGGTAQPEAVEVRWCGPEGPETPGPGRAVTGGAAGGGAVHGSAADGGTGGLPECAAALARAGWQVTQHRDWRTGRAYLLASPRRA